MNPNKKSTGLYVNKYRLPHHKRPKKKLDFTSKNQVNAKTLATMLERESYTANGFTDNFIFLSSIEQSKRFFVPPMLSNLETLIGHQGVNLLTTLFKNPFSVLLSLFIRFGVKKTLASITRKILLRNKNIFGGARTKIFCDLRKKIFFQDTVFFPEAFHSSQRIGLQQLEYKHAQNLANTEQKIQRMWRIALLVVFSLVMMGDVFIFPSAFDYLLNLFTEPLMLSRFFFLIEASISFLPYNLAEYLDVTRWLQKIFLGAKHGFYQHFSEIFTNAILSEEQVVGESSHAFLCKWTEEDITIYGNPSEKTKKEVMVEIITWLNACEDEIVVQVDERDTLLIIYNFPLSADTLQKFDALVHAQYPQPEPPPKIYEVLIEEDALDVVEEKRKQENMNAALEKADLALAEEKLKQENINAAMAAAIKEAEEEQKKLKKRTQKNAKLVVTSPPETLSAKQNLIITAKPRTTKEKPSTTTSCEKPPATQNPSVTIKKPLKPQPPKKKPVAATPVEKPQAKQNPVVPIEKPAELEREESIPHTSLPPSPVAADESTHLPPAPTPIIAEAAESMGRECNLLSAAQPNDGSHPSESPLPTPLYDRADDANSITTESSFVSTVDEISQNPIPPAVDSHCVGISQEEIVSVEFFKENATSISTAISLVTEKINKEELDDAKIRTLLTHASAKDFFSAIEVNNPFSKKKTYLTGGALSSVLQGETPRDYDFVTELSCKEIQKRVKEPLASLGYTLRISARMPNLVTIEKNIDGSHYHIDVVCNRHLSTEEGRLTEARRKDLRRTTLLLASNGEILEPLPGAKEDAKMGLLSPTTNWAQVLCAPHAAEEADQLIAQFDFQNLNPKRVMRIIDFAGKSKLKNPIADEEEFSEIAQSAFLSQETENGLFQLQELQNSLPHSRLIECLHRYKLIDTIAYHRLRTDLTPKKSFNHVVLMDAIRASANCSMAAHNAQAHSSAPPPPPQPIIIVPAPPLYYYNSPLFPLPRNRDLVGAQMTPLPLPYYLAPGPMFPPPSQ